MFKDFKVAIQGQFDKIKKHALFHAEIDKDLLWETYLSSWPEGSNPIFRERTEHDCQCCKSFIRSVGGVVAIVDGKMESIWDAQIGGSYQVVADALSSLVKSKPIENIFLHIEGVAGTDKNLQQIESGEILTWEHFYVKIPGEYVVAGESKGTKLSEARNTKDVFLRSLKEITLDSIDTVLDLIGQNSLYRGEENQFAVDAFRKERKAFANLHSEQIDIFCWSKTKDLPQSVSRIRNTAIGTLLIDLSEGKSLESSVASFEAKVAPTNYKRPTALITKTMIKKAQEKVEELGFSDALQRRYAAAEDITVNNIIFANREAKKRMNVFEELTSQAPENIQKLDKVEEVGIDAFIKNVLPKAESIELMFENRHAGNLFSLIAPVSDSKGMFKWHNNFSWAYAGNLADSIKERVKNAGGNVEGDLRCSLSWFNHDDLDLHMVEPDGTHIYFSIKLSPRTGGNLDVDMNAGHGKTRSAVENICYPSRNKMPEGVYKLHVHNYQKRESIDVGFEAEIEFDGIIYSFGYAKAVRNEQSISVAKFRYSKKGGIEIIESLPSSQASKEIWGIATQQFHGVSMIMYSPNHWDGKKTGNRHYFFIVKNCLNDGAARGFFNEFLTDELREHRKVFEVLGSKMKAPETTNQLSGLGFSSTQRNQVFCRVRGSFARTIKIIL